MTVTKFEVVTFNTTIGCLLLFILSGTMTLTTTLLFYGSSLISVDLIRVYVLYPIWFFVAYSLYQSWSDIHKQIHRWIIVSVVVSVVGILEWLFGGGTNIHSIASGQTRVISTLFSPNALAWYLVAMNSLIIGSMSKDPSRVRFNAAGIGYWLILVIFLMHTVVIVMSGSRGGLLVNALMFSLWACKRLNKVRVALLLVSSSLFIGVLMLAAPADIGIGELRVFDSMTTSRWSIYTDLFVIFLDANILDIFLGFSAPMFSLLKESGYLDDSYVLVIMASSGLLGLTLYFVILISGLIRSLLARKRVHPSSYVSVFYVVFACFVLGLVGNVQGIFPIGIIFWVTFGMLVKMNSRSFSSSKL